MFTKCFGYGSRFYAYAVLALMVPVAPDETVILLTLSLHHY